MQIEEEEERGGRQRNIKFLKQKNQHRAPQHFFLSSVPPSYFGRRKQDSNLMTCPQSLGDNNLKVRLMIELNTKKLLGSYAPPVVQNLG